MAQQQNNLYFNPFFSDEFKLIEDYNLRKQMILIYFIRHVYKIYPLNLEFCIYYFRLYSLASCKYDCPCH